MSRDPVKQEMGRLARERGAENEARALAAAKACADRVTWIKSVRAGTPEEDARGIDLVVETDIGALCFQVKSCKFAVQEFREKRRGALVEPVVATPEVKTMEARMLGALWRLRNKILALRGDAPS